jgi:ferrous iron transport protein B
VNVLLVGQPNVGKSVVFTRLTGVHVISSNYPGTTVEFTEGQMTLGVGRATIVDVPGVYSLGSPSSKADEVAARMIAEGDLIVNVVDATNLERNLRLTLQLLQRRKPMVVALNLADEARHMGIDIDWRKLEQLLGVPVVPTVAITGEGMKELVGRLAEAGTPPAAPEREEDALWTEVGHLVNAVQTVRHRHHTFLEWLGDCTVKPISGLCVAAVVLPISFLAVRFVGEGITIGLMEPVFDRLWKPVIMRLSAALGSGGVLHSVLIGSVIQGDVDYMQSFGLLTTGLFVPLAVVMPYLIAFYLWLGLVEDFGYLPRLAVLLDRLFHKVGLHGWAIVPNLLGLGCNVPGILATRVLESRRERFIAATLVSIAVPCAALQAMIWSLVGDPARGGGGLHVILVYSTLLVVWFVIGRLLNKTLTGASPELLMEIPPYRWPLWRGVVKKLGMRLRGFAREGVPLVLLGVLVVNLLHLTPFFDVVAALTAPLTTRLLGLPDEATAALMIGIFRKDMAMGLLGAMHLTITQLVVASTVLAMFFPCVATFAVLFRELGPRDTAKSTAIMVIAALAAGGILNAVL